MGVEECKTEHKRVKGWKQCLVQMGGHEETREMKTKTKMKMSTSTRGRNKKVVTLQRWIAGQGKLRVELAAERANTKVILIGPAADKRLKLIWSRPDPA